MKITYGDICKKMEDETQSSFVLKDTDNGYIGNRDKYFIPSQNCR